MIRRRLAMPEQGAFGGVVVVSFGKRDEVGGVDEGSIVDPCLPETVFPQIQEGIFRSVFVIVFADEEETGGEAVAELLTPGYVFGCREAFVDQIEDREQQERFVRWLVALARHADDADVEVVETFDGGVEGHELIESDRGRISQF